MGMTYTQEQKELIAAARGGDVEGIKAIIATGFNVDCELKYGSSALMLAAAKGHEEVVRVLGAAGAKVNRRNRFGATALLEATDKGHLGVLKLLVQLGAEINLPHNNGNTAIFVATTRRDRKTIKMLLELGADPELKNFDGWSARSWAEAESDLTIQALFGIRKADGDHMYHGPEGNKLESNEKQRAAPAAGASGAFWTVFMRAATSGDVDTVRRLVDEGIEVNAQSPNGTTALMAAVKNGQAATAFELIELGADLSLADEDGMTAIEWAKKTGQAIILKGLEDRTGSTTSDRPNRDTAAA